MNTTVKSSASTFERILHCSYNIVKETTPKNKQQYKKPKSKMPTSNYKYNYVIT